MSRIEKINILKQYRDVINYLKRYEEKEEIKTEEKQKVLVLTKKYKGRTFKVV